MDSPFWAGVLLQKDLGGTPRRPRWGPSHRKEVTVVPKLLKAPLTQQTNPGVNYASTAQPMRQPATGRVIRVRAGSINLNVITQAPIRRVNAQDLLPCPHAGERTLPGTGS